MTSIVFSSNMADKGELDMKTCGAQKVVHSPALDEDFLRWKGEAQALDLSVKATASYFADQHRQLHQQLLLGSNMQLQQRHRIEQHRLYMDQQEAVHHVNHERPAELHLLHLQEAHKKSQLAAVNSKLKIQPLMDDEKVEDYLAHFERLTTLH